MSGFISLYTSVVRGVARASWAAGRGLAQRVGDAHLSASNRLPAAGAFDHRGLYPGSTPPRAIVAGEFPIGRFLSTAGWTGRPVGIPEPRMRRHACVIGPSGAGKTHSITVLCIVAAARCGYSVVSIDVKGDMLDLFRAEV